MHQPLAPVGCICNTLRKASRSMTRFYDEALADSGLSIQQFALLRRIAKADLPLSRLAEMLVMDRTSLYRALAPLERRGLLAIHDDERGRTKRASLTDAGREAIAEARDPWAVAQQRIIDTLGAEHWAAIETGLNELIRISEDARA